MSREMKEIFDGYNKGVEMKDKLVKLARYMDAWYKRSKKMMDAHNPDNPEHVSSITIYESQLRTLEAIAEQIEKDFQILVLTERREKGNIS